MFEGIHIINQIRIPKRKLISFLRRKFLVLVLFAMSVLMLWRDGSSVSLALMQEEFILLVWIKLQYKNARKNILVYMFKKFKVFYIVKRVLKLNV